MTRAHPGLTVREEELVKRHGNSIEKPIGREIGRIYLLKNRFLRFCLQNTRKRCKKMVLSLIKLRGILID